MADQAEPARDAAEAAEAPPPPPREIDDLAALKTLAHPRRGRIMRHLTGRGPATSAGLARALGLNTGATSYHLRELARHGFVEEISPDGAHGRERWWRAVRADLRFPPRSRQTPDMRAALDEMNRLSFAADIEAFVRYRHDTPADDPWADAAPYSRGTVHVTVDELAEFFEEFIALTNRYKRDPDTLPPGVRLVRTRFLAFPDPDPGATHRPGPDHEDPAATRD
ncbi:helix-turn-helix domain-containing protein [Yinghuangia sp. ASG 101]|uniref:ArsR/SmtB family transcription factor n=1 Tax=Yinghuangia sp. ASG 101 TaxID=2896848 RepID=UPI001E4BB0FA|nr:helix-turn-helix domain-containing protein [Yinghuangia sp. ASG 101]UGQ15068.1 helix-turn-helix domain-containing protein [Yinghuangia sp. ASG 101]